MKVTLLAATLRTYQRAGCDSEQLSLSCPRGTSISIELAQYGRAGDLSDHSLCPPVSQEDLTTTGSAGDAVIHSGTEIEVKPPETCTVSGLQYALLQTVVDACQKKRHCKFAANSKTHTSGDPCSGIRKFVEIAYKCRPYEFRSKLACENDNMPLMCNPYSRIAIYSATFGHTERESVQCGGQGAGATTTINREDNSKPTCLVSYATETVMQICHGRRRCSVTADAGTFGRPCKTDVRMYLKVVYTCIPRKVLKDRYETAPEADEPQQTDLDLDQDELYDEDQFYKESEAIPPAPKLQGANVGRSFDFDVHGAAAEDGIVTSTLLPPLLSRDDGALEARLQSSVRLLNRIKESFNQQSLAEVVANEHIITTSVEPRSDAANMDNEDKALDSSNETTTAEQEPELQTEQAATDGNFFYRRKCQMVDDWGPIGLNCTEEDIVTERVEVVGFLANWLHTYLHIRKHQEQFYLYLIISVTAGVLLCLTLVIGRLTLQKRGGRKKRSSSGNSGAGKGFAEAQIDSTESGGAGAGVAAGLATGETHLPDSFADDISDIDVDVDLTTPVPLSSLSARNE
ncbi:CG42402, partial [Drosophila busckii]